MKGLRHDSFFINETTVEESMPPDKKAPTGTSANILIETASVSKVSR